MIKKNNILTLFMFSCLLLLSSCIENIDPEILNELDEETMKDVDIDKALKKLSKDMTFGEALVSGYYHQHKKDNEMMIKCYERALTVGGKQALMKRLTIQLAEAYIIQKDYEKAKKHANTYVTLYPGDKEARKAAFLEIQASYLDTRIADRDQQKTAETIELIDAYKKNYSNSTTANLDDEYREKIDEILVNSYNKIIESEINIAETYLNRYNHFKNFSALNAAQKRIKHVKTAILPKIGVENKKLNDLEESVDRNMRFELSKIVVQQSSENAEETLDNSQTNSNLTI